jgi:hypothetical protein
MGSQREGSRMHGNCDDDTGERQTQNGNDDGDYARCPVHRTQIAVKHGLAVTNDQ